MTAPNTPQSPPRWSRPSARGPLSAATGLLVVIIVLPLVAVGVFGVQAISQPEVLVSLLNSVLPTYLLNTLLLAGFSGLIALALGVPSAWFVTAYEFPGRRLLEWSLVVPMAMPAYVLAYAYTDALDPSGWLYQIIQHWVAGAGFNLPRIDIRSLWGASIVLGVALSPYVALLAKNAFADRQGAVFDAARAMGLSAFQVFFRLAVPLARPAWIAGFALVVMECFADYGTVAFFSVPTLSTGLFKAWFNYGDRSSAALIALVMMITVTILLYIEHRTRGRAAWATSRIGTRAHPTPVVGLTAATMAAYCAIPGLIGFVIPVMLLLYSALSAQAVPQIGLLVGQAMNTVVLASVAVVVIIPCGWLGAYGLRSAGAITTRSVRLAAAGYAMPGLVIAVGLLAWSALFTEIADRWLGWRVALVGTGMLLLGAYLTRFFSVGLSAIESGLNRVTRNLEWSASSLGLSPLQIVSRVHFPIVRGAIGVAALLVFVDVVKELPATLVLRPFNLETLAVSAHHLAADELLAQAAWPALMIAVVGLLPLLFLGPALRRDR